MADFAIVEVGDHDASSRLLIVFRVPVRITGAQEYCEMVWAGDDGSYVGQRRSTLPVRRCGTYGDLLRIVGQRSPIPREGGQGVDAWEFGEVIRK